MARRRHYRKPKLPVSHRGIWATAIGIISVIVYLVVTMTAAKRAGEVSAVYQILSFVTMAETFVGIAIAISSFKEEGTSLFLKLTGIITSVSIEILWLVYYIAGVASL